ncbi:trihelix transcription factor ASIL2-like [Durio zibethinus]|uniref:Trihelix transcription factor ASIL2-like n=1 Tax=Durio zibethinus TaxID=66656 RepID=A0A6P5XZR7_DURZI|nr:trihelix transcription factor ASIL2-like [Durio zibethinus]XP_022733655.1 trihelix transcription factor ASIL2-like [Durio zibethinus]XP_022733656.1 trihelix transcription factor ASIL2-like [Durio zibethinus]
MSNPSSPLEPRSNTSPPPPSEPPLALPAPPASTSTPSATTTVTPNPRRLPPPCWSHDETIALIDAYRDIWYTLRRGNLKATHWQDVADTVARRCPLASPPKTAVQCRHKMEKLRKRYRTEIQRARSMPVSRFSSSWVHFKRMDAMEKGPNVKPDYNSNSPDEGNDEDDEDDQDQDFYEDGYKNGSVNTRSIQKLYRNGIGNSGGTVSGGGGGSSGGFRIRIPTGVSIAQPGPRFYGKMDEKYAANANSNVNPHPNKGNFGGSGYGTRVLMGFEDTPGKTEPSGRRERDAVKEMVSAIKALGDGFVRMEQMKMEMAREIESTRMDMEMKRTEMILGSQQRIIEAFAKAVSERNKKPKRMPSPEP